MLTFGFVPLHTESIFVNGDVIHYKEIYNWISYSEWSISHGVILCWQINIHILYIFQHILHYVRLLQDICNSGGKNVFIEIDSLTSPLKFILFFCFFNAPYLSERFSLCLSLSHIQLIPAKGEKNKKISITICIFFTDWSQFSSPALNMSVDNFYTCVCALENKWQLHARDPVTPPMI